jgi:RHS repeat-associated protein
MRASTIRIVTLLLALSFGIVGAEAQEISDPPGSDRAAQPLDAEALRQLGISGDTAQSPTAPPVVESGGFSWTHGPLRYDGSGNIASIGTQAFFYDTHARLTAATLSRPDQPGSLTQSYQYDAFGNLIARTTGGVLQSNPTDNTTNHLSTAYAEYDAAGNQVRWQSVGAAIYHATYDAVGTVGELDVENVTGAGPMFFVYTASDERIWSHDGAANVGHWKLRDLDGKVLRDFVDNWNTPSTPWSVSRDYFYRDGALLAAATPTTTLHFSLDHLGSPRVITDNGRVRMGFHHYLPFGEEWLDGTGSQEGEVMKFTGHERDKDPAGSTADLDYMHARYYSAAWGRFMSMDPAPQSVDMKSPESWNRYTYVANNPLNSTDPDGRCSFVLDNGTSYTDDSPICYEVKPHWSPEDLRRRGDVAVAQEKAAFDGGADISFSAGFHIPISPGVAVGPTVASTARNAFKNIREGNGAPLTADGVSIDWAFPVIADIGVAAGITDWSGTNGASAAPFSINLGLGTRGGVQIIPRKSIDKSKALWNPARYIDGVSVGLGVGIAFPVNVSASSGRIW